MLSLPRTVRVFLVALLALSFVGCPAPRRDDDPPRPSPARPVATGVPSCQVAWAQLPAGDRGYQPAQDSEQTPLGNQGYRRYLERTARPKCEKEWTVLLYMAADTKDLQKPALQTLRAIERAGRLAADGDADLIVQIDLQKQPGIRRLHVLGLGDSPADSDDPSSLRSPIVEYTSDESQPPQDSLRSFLAWGIDHYPSRRYMVIVWGHGLGWRPRAGKDQRAIYDPSRPLGGIAPDESERTVFDIPSLRDALRSASEEKLSGRPFDLLATDACLMQTVEVSTELADTARYFVATETKVDYDGLPYGAILESLVSPDIAPESVPHSSRCGRDDRSCVLALKLPAISMSQTGTAPGATRGPNFLLSVVELSQLRTGLSPSLQSLGQALAAYLAEDPTRSVAIQQLLTVKTGVQFGASRTLPDFPGGTRDLGVFLLNLRTVVRKEASRSESPSCRAVLSAIDQSESALASSVLSLAAGNRYEEERFRGLAGISAWLPSTPEEWTERRPFFAPSLFYRRSDTGLLSGWESFLSALYAGR